MSAGPGPAILLNPGGIDGAPEFPTGVSRGVRDGCLALACMPLMCNPPEGDKRFCPRLCIPPDGENGFLDAAAMLLGDGQAGEEETETADRKVAVVDEALAGVVDERPIPPE